MSKMLVCQCEDVLINSEGAIFNSTMIKIDELRSNDNLFTITTGRDLESVLYYNKSYPFIDYIIYCEGAYVLDVNKDKVIYKRNIGINIIKKIKKTFEHYSVCFYTLNGVYCLGTKFNNDDKVITDFDSFFLNNKSEIYKIRIWCQNKREINNIITDLNELGLSIDYIRGSEEKFFIDIVASGVNKLVGIEKICKIRKIKLEEVVAVGKDNSDILMMKSVGYGVTLNNCLKEVKNISQIVFSSNDDRGVEEIIKKFF